MDGPEKYRPFYSKAQTWDFIESRFVADFGGRHQRMIELVKHIRHTGLADRLYGSTSLDKLVVSIYEQIDYRREALHIKYDLNHETWNFNYYAMPFQNAEFVRTYSADKGIEKFDNIIKMIRW